MEGLCTVGDLVHIPQSVALVDCELASDPQLHIPLRVKNTPTPTLGVVTQVCKRNGLLKVYCEGDKWMVEERLVYRLKGAAR